MASTAYAIRQLSKLGEVERSGPSQLLISVTVGDRVISFFNMYGGATAFNVRHINDHDNIAIDYFAGSHFRNLAQAIRYVKRYAIKEA